MEKTCPNCDTLFLTTMPKKQIYCKPECREEAQAKRRDGIIASISAERTTYLAERFAVFEHDRYKCTYCGRGLNDGVKLDTMDDGEGRLRTICEECKVGKEETT